MEQGEASKLVESLFESWQPYLANYAFDLTNSFESAEDLVQETFMALYRELRGGRHIEHPRAWMLAVVRNLASVSVRNQRRRGEVLTPPGDLDLLPGQEARPNEPDVGAITQYLTVLSKREAEALLLRVECHRYREIASKLGISHKTVASLLARALRKLKSQVTAKARGDAPLDRKEFRVLKTL